MNPKTIIMVIITLVLTGALILVNEFYYFEVIEKYAYLFAIGFLVIAHFLAEYIVKKKGLK